MGRALNWARGVVARVAAGDCVELWTDAAIHEVNGNAAGQVVALIDGVRSASDIASELQQKAGSAAAVHYTLQRLLKKGLLVESQSGAPVDTPRATMPLIGGIWRRREAGGLVHVCGAEVALPTGSRTAVCGSGVSAQQAEESARMEAVERFSLYHHSAVPITHGRLSDLQSQAVDPSRLHLFSESQSLRPGAAGVLRPGQWVEGRCVDRDGSLGATRLLPASYCYFSVPAEPRAASSNGCAAGAVFEDAAVRAFLELVERDAVAIWWYNRLRRPALALSGSAVRSIAEELAREGWQLHLLDLTTDLSIAVAAAVAVSEETGTARLGFGASWTSDDAALRAILEVSQSLAYPEFLVGGLPVPMEPWLKPHGTMGAEPAPASDRKRGLADCAEVAWNCGLELILADQTHPEIGIPVCRAIVPGLRPALPRFGPGRLFDIPNRLGWLSPSQEEKALNPIAFDI